MTFEAFSGGAPSLGLVSGDLASRNEHIDARLSFAVLNLVSIVSKAIDVLAKCFMTTAAYLVSEVFFKFIPIVGALISMAASLTCIIISATKMSRCASKLKAVIDQNKACNFNAVRDVTLYSMVKNMEIAMHFIVFALAIVAIGLMFFSGAAFFLPGLILTVVLTIILFIAYQIIHYVCKIDDIERRYMLDDPLN